ncbi:MAG: hypothetical protein FWF84_02055, partial [Kiritimatiellaeota bacterium]|nr:hypothetical protein [Kiritimatiellota bacterium]
MHRKSLTFYVLLMGLPAVVFCACAVGLLAGVRGRLVEAEREQGRWAAQRKAQEVIGFVADIQSNLLRQVSTLPQGTLDQALREMQRRDPFVRNVFVWQEGFVLPAATTTNEEERRFLFRFAPLFNGDVPWTDTHGEGVGDVATSGWRPWFDGDRLHLLGWFATGLLRDEEGVVIIGCELEMTAIVARLHAMLQGSDFYAASHGFELNDGQTSMLQWDIIPDDRPRPVAEVSLAPTLPHWTIRAYPIASAFSFAYGSIYWVG